MGKVELLVKFVLRAGGYALLFYGMNMIHPGLLLIFLGVFVLATTKD